MWSELIAMHHPRSLLCAGVLATACVLAPACAPRAIVALPSTASTWVDDYTARAKTTTGVTVEARTRGWAGGPPLALGTLATPVFVRIANDGFVPLRVSRDDFELV